MEQGEKTKDGFEVHFGVNHLAHLLLAQILKDHLASEIWRQPHRLCSFFFVEERKD
jgi:hypothetical protein